MRTVRPSALGVSVMSSSHQSQAKSSSTRYSRTVADRLML
jgi:hypothetical protein